MNRRPRCTLTTLDLAEECEPVDGDDPSTVPGVTWPAAPAVSEQLERERRRWDTWADDRLPAGTRTRAIPGGRCWPLAFEPTDLSASAPVLVHLPGRWGNGRRWAAERPSSDLRVALAEAGFPSVTAHYRLSPANSTDLAVDDIATVRTHHLLDDVVAAVAAAQRVYGSRPVVLCGFSLGASLGFLAAANPAVRALVALDGGLPPSGLARLGDVGCVANPNLHPRHVAAALARIRSTEHPAELRDQLRWRLGQDLWWPVAQLSEIRTGIADAGEELGGRLRTVTCPILCIAADDRDDPDDPRGPRTAARTGAEHVRTVRLRNWRHEDVVTRTRERDEGLLRNVIEFLDAMV